MLRRLYDWTLSLAARPSAPYALAAVSFFGKLLLPGAAGRDARADDAARPDKAWFYALICTITSVLGGILGYVIGLVLYDSIGRGCSGSMGWLKGRRRSGTLMPNTAIG
jgi:membrane protein YqaA with SNARE-associated domain